MWRPSALAGENGRQQLEKLKLYRFEYLGYGQQILWHIQRATNIARKQQWHWYLSPTAWQSRLQCLPAAQTVTAQPTADAAHTPTEKRTHTAHACTGRVHAGKRRSVVRPHIIPFSS